MTHKSLRTALRMSALGMMIPLSLYVTSWFAEQYLLPTQNSGAVIPRTATGKFTTPRNDGRSPSIKTAPETRLELKLKGRIVPAGATVPND